MADQTALAHHDWADRALPCSLRRELLDDCGPFQSLATAQQAVDAWVYGCNHTRPHQAPSMATPFSAFRPVPGLTPPSLPTAAQPESQRVPIPQPRRHDAEILTESQAVELDMVISPVGRITLPGANSANHLKFPAALGGQPVTIWADLRSIHVTLAGEIIRTRQSRLTIEDLAYLRLRGHQASPEPARSAAPRGAVLVGTAINVERTVGRDGDIALAAWKLKLGGHLSGQRVTLRLDRHLAHVIADGYLVKTLPAPTALEQAARLNGAHAATGPLPPALQGTVKVMRAIPADGITGSVNGLSGFSSIDGRREAVPFLMLPIVMIADVRGGARDDQLGDSCGNTRSAEAGLVGVGDRASCQGDPTDCGKIGAGLPAAEAATVASIHYQRADGPRAAAWTARCEGARTPGLPIRPPAPPSPTAGRRSRSW